MSCATPKIKKTKYFEYESKLKKAYRQLKKAYREVKDSYTDMIFRFALAAEYKDEATGEHLVRIADYCTAIAGELSLSEQDIYRLRYASLMHDIGKLIIPDEILKKPAGLTPEERETVKQHTSLGAEIFKGSPTKLLQATHEVILTHHERYDGTGYPKGLKGTEIPLFGRIVALADVFDTLTSKRPYKAAYDFDEAIKIIKRQIGKHFDPKIVSAFLKKKTKIRRLWQATKDINSFLDDKKAGLQAARS